MTPTKYQGIGGMQSYTPEERLEYYTWNNAVAKLAWGIVGGKREYDALTRGERKDVREMAKQLYDLGRDIPTAKAAEKTCRQGFVYIITNPAWPDHIKVGRAFNPESRLKGYQTGCPQRDYALYAAVYFTDCHKAEKVIHDWLCDYNAEGEWFRMLPQVAEQVIYELREMNYVG